MIPCIATVAIREHDRRSRRLWLPLGLVWLLLLPVILLLLPFFFIACLAIRVRPFDALSIFSEILSSLKGTDLEFQRQERIIELRLL